MIVYDRNRLIDAIKASAETIADTAEAQVPGNIKNIRSAKVTISIEPDTIPTMSWAFEMFPEKKIVSLAGWGKDDEH